MVVEHCPLSQVIRLVSCKLLNFSRRLAFQRGASAENQG